MIAIAVSFFWLSNRRFKRCPKGKYGFVVAISVENQLTAQIFERDFVHNLQVLLEAGTVSDRIWVYMVPQHLIELPLTTEAIDKIKNKTRSRFVLYGQVRTREEGSEKKHYVDLSGLVTCAETADHNKQRLAHEFSELLPRRSIASAGSELPAFELVSAVSSLVAKYIAGIAALLSGDLEYAGNLYSDAERIARTSAASHEVAKKIIDRLPVRRAEISMTTARGAYNRWRVSHSEGDLEEMLRNLRTAPDAAHEMPEYKVLTAIGMIADAAGDYNSIERTVRTLSHDDPVIQMNLAFFDIVRADYRSATRHYKKAFELDVSMETIEEVMAFLDWFGAFRPELMSQVSFALGSISCHILRDIPMSKTYFDDFKNACGSNNPEEFLLIEKWLNELERL